MNEIKMDLEDTVLDLALINGAIHPTIADMDGRAVVVDSHNGDIYLIGLTKLEP